MDSCLIIKRTVLISVLVLFYFLSSCEERSKNYVQKDTLALIKNREFLRKHSFCTCMELVNTCQKEDYSKGIYFEKSSYDPEAFLKIDSFVKSHKPTYKSYTGKSLGTAECLDLYESDSLKNEIESLDAYLSQD
ncbi:MAG: hypothetical protein H7329_18385 [Opitutaceae bacterium]|nr:hypothetical protein [Cytophagales bacterium]